MILHICHQIISSLINKLATQFINNSKLLSSKNKQIMIHCNIWNLFSLILINLSILCVFPIPIRLISFLLMLNSTLPGHVVVRLSNYHEICVHLASWKCPVHLFYHSNTILRIFFHQSTRLLHDHAFYWLATVPHIFCCCTTHIRLNFTTSTLSMDLVIHKFSIAHY